MNGDISVSVASIAIVGLSRPRGNRTFEGLPLDDIPAARDTEPRCGLAIIDITTGDTVAWLLFGVSTASIPNSALDFSRLLSTALDCPRLLSGA